MTDNEIVKALECCTDYSYESLLCRECPYFEYGFNRRCRDELSEDSLALINRQKSEIGRLKEENERYKECNRIIAYQRDKSNDEIQELHSELRGLNFMRKQIKSEAIKEFEKEVEKALECNYEVRRNRMKSVHCGNDEFLSYLNGKIDCLRALQEFAKEMAGERE